MAGLSDNIRGSAFMVISMAGFVANDTMVKLVSVDLGLFQVVLWRGLFATALIGALAWQQGALFRRLARQDAWMLTLRMVGELGGTLCFLTALFQLPIANVSAILQVTPLAVTLAAAFFLSEPVGWRRYLAIVVGFIGVLMIVRPGAEGFSAASVWAVAAVGFIVLRDITTRNLSHDIPSMFIAFSASLSVTFMGAAIAPFTPQAPVQPWHLIALGAAGLFLFFGYVFSVMTMRIGEISFISPFRYTILIWAMLSGIFVFQDFPDGMTLLGGGVITATGIYTFYRERKLAIQAAARRAQGEHGSLSSRAC